ncbi:helix-turn-helix domain-containing protein [Myceligenerans halotolerans]
MQARQLESLLRKLPDLAGATSPSPERSVPGRVKRLSPEQIRQIVEGYEAGATVYELGDQFGIDRKRVSRILKVAGVRTRGAGLTPAQIDEAVQLYEDGWSPAQIGEKFGAHARTIQRRLRERGGTERA